MKLSLITPLSAKTLQVAWLELNTPAGNFVILPGHAPMLVTLSPHKKITYGLSSGKQESHLVHRGIAEIDRHVATIIMDEVRE
jgi:F0F1-type ATP synthase epsilon subunit